MTIGVEEMVAMANLKKISDKHVTNELTRTCKRKREEGELKGGGTPSVARILFLVSFRDE